MIIHILQEDIDRGRDQCKRYPGTNNSCCPIGQSMTRQKMYQVYLNVNSETLQLDNVVHALPAEAKDFVWRFDSNLKVSPFQFEIND